MRQRCENPNDWAYKDYGGRGITVCEPWKIYENFLKDMGHPPTMKHTLDRKNNDKGYNPYNCRWALRDVQAHNQRPRASSGYRGVYKFRNKFRASIMRGTQKIYLGSFDSKEEAYQAYLVAEKVLYGD